MNRLQSLMVRPSRSGGYDGFETALINGLQYAFAYGTNQTLGQKIENIDANFVGLTQRAYKSNGIVFSVMLARMMLFTEARFQFQHLTAGRPGDLWGDQRLAILESPWPGGTTGDLLKYMITDHDLAGNGFVALPKRNRSRLVRLRPDWTTMVHGSLNADATMWDPDVELLGFGYQPGGPAWGRPPIFFDSSEVAHFSTIPDPELPLRGMAWLTPIIREIMGDQAMTEHRLQFFEHGATPSMIVKTNFPKLDAVAKEWIAFWKQEHEGIGNAYKTAFLSAGSDATVVGANLQQIDFKAVQGGGETRIAAAGGVPPIVAGLSEGLQGSSLNAGNFAASMRRFADLTARPLWRNAAGSLERIVPAPSGNRLWYDSRDIPALKDDVKDAAEVQGLQAAAIRTLTDGGYDAESVVDAIVSGDLKRLTHTGLLSVQLNPPNTKAPADQPIPDMPMNPGDMQPPTMPTGGAA